MSRFGEHHPNVLWTLLHLAGQVESSSKHERRVRSPNLNLRVEAPHVDLGCSQGLLPYA
jgi:hypothetical protein